MHLKLPLIGERVNTTDLTAFESKNIFIIGRYCYVMLNIIKGYKIKDLKMITCCQNSMLVLKKSTRCGYFTL